MKQIVTGELNDEQLEREMAEVLAVLEGLGIAEVEVEHWSGRGAVSVSVLSELRSSEDAPMGLLQPWAAGWGHADFDIHVLSRNLHFQFCHHDELHVRTADLPLEEQFWQRWERLGYAGRWRDGEDEEDGEEEAVTNPPLE